MIVQITFNKRKNGLLKKACELAVLCNIKMVLSFNDLAGNIYLFQSPNSSAAELINSRNKKQFTPADYPNFQKKRNSTELSEESSEESKNHKGTKCDESKKTRMKLRNQNKILADQEDNVQKLIKIEQAPQQKQALIKKKVVEIPINEFKEREQNFDDLYQFDGNCYNADSDSGQSKNIPHQQFTSSNVVKFLKGDSFVNYKMCSESQGPLSRFISKDRNNFESNNNSKLFVEGSNYNTKLPMNPSVQFIVPPQMYFQNPSPLLMPLKQMYVEEDDQVVEKDPIVTNDRFRKYTK